MSALPGKRHRTLAPSSRIGEADLAAVERAIVDITEGVHGEVKSQVPHAGAFAPGGDWTLFVTGSYWVSGGGAGSVLWVSLPLFAGDALRTVDIVAQAGSATAITLEVLEIDVDARSSRVIATDPTATTIGAYVRRSFNFVSPQRPRGLRISEGVFHRIRVTAGSTTDRFLGALTNISHPRAA